MNMLLLENRWLLAEQFRQTRQDEFSFHCSSVVKSPGAVWVKDSHLSDMSKHLRDEQFLQDN